jgi:TrmH family RNA methyltransferase
MKSWKDNISFILIDPKEAGNIGASARALKNMGFKNLELVKPVLFFTDETRFMACDAVDVVEQATVHSDLKDAIKDKSLVIGTTRRLGKQRGLIIPLKGSIKRIVLTAKKNRVAILFGREDKGLSNKVVEECGFLITIPTDSLSPSLNLAQSILLVAYELSQKVCSGTTPVIVKHEELENFYNRTNSTLKLLEYITRGNRDLEMKIMRNLKHLIGRTGLTDWELRMLYGICSQVEKKVKGIK